MRWNSVRTLNSKRTDHIILTFSSYLDAPFDSMKLRVNEINVNGILNGVDVVYRQ